LRAMAALGEYHELRAPYRSPVDLSGAARHYAILLAPQDESPHAAHAFEKVRQARIVHIGLPSDARGLRPALPPGLELLRRLLGAVEVRELWRARRIEHARSQVGLSGEKELIQDLAFRRPDPSSPDEHHLREQRGVVRRHLRGDPSSEGKTDDVDRRERLFA